MNVTNSIMALRQMACSPQYAVRKQILIEAASELEQLQVELNKERARLDWLLPYQHAHTTRYAIDKEMDAERARARFAMGERTVR